MGLGNGFFGYLFDSDWLQRAHLNQLEDRAEKLEDRLYRNREQAIGVEHDVAALRRDIAGMMLMMETFQRILADKGICSREDLVARMRAIDAEDGVVDGKMSPGSQGEADLRYCDGCQHFNPARLRNCQYCGRVFGSKKT